MASRSMLMSSIRFVLVLLSRAAQEILITRESMDTMNQSVSEIDFVSSKLNAVIAGLKSDGTLIEWFSKSPVPERVKNNYSENLATFLKRPVFNFNEVEDLYHMLARPPTPDHASVDQSSKETLRSLRMMLEKRKKELADVMMR